MSYNTRRSGGFGGGPQQNVGNIGQRRPVVTNNFVPGGQLNQNKPGMQSNQQQRPAHVQQPQQQQQHQPQGNTNINFRTQQTPQNQGYQTAQQSPLPVQQTPPQPQVKPEPLTPKPAAAPVVPGMNPPNPLLEASNGEQMEQDTTEDEATPKRKPFWAKTANKLSRKEKMRRRNVRLSKMLQPKNAVMILNELVKNTVYDVEEIAIKSDTNQFRAVVVVDGVEHVGVGRSKIQAKNTAAETALKHLIKYNKLSEMKKDDEGNEKMDVSDDDSQAPLPWQHVASFALFKLFCSWGEDPNIVKNAGLLNSTGSDKPQHENKPAKKMPANPESMNPLMLINQMLPQAQFEEIGKSGSPPTVTYSYRCNAEGQSFIGTGPNKKAAKKLAAFGACNKILNVTYPTDVYVPIY